MSQPQCAPLLLAFLTQTARFHPKLIRNNDPIATADFYAEATIRSMGFDFLSDATLEKVQTLLLLGYHEWTALQGSRGWLRIGSAIRAAQLLRYHTDADRDDGRRSTGTESETRMSERDQFVLRETQRRTFWSCCLMDRYLSLGEDRPSMIKHGDFRVQLICSDNAYNFGRKVRTRHLGENNAAYERRRVNTRKPVDRQSNQQHESDQDLQAANPDHEFDWEIGIPEDEFTWYMPVVELFGDITKWSCNSGRRQEGRTPPWDTSTGFKQLDDRLQRLKSELPKHLQLTPENTDYRIYNGSEKYVLIHAMYTLCTVSLYREYMPMAPWGVTKPRGPLEEPLITQSPPHETYWIDQAKACWKACKDLASLLHSIRSAGTIIESPTVAFAAFTVALCTIYCHIFPNMDPDGALSSKLQPRAHDTANGYLTHMKDRFKMARSWIEYAGSWQKYYIEERRKYKRLGGNVGDSPRSSASDGGGNTGPLRDYTQHFEQQHKQFGTTDHNDNSQWVNKDKHLAAILLHDDDVSDRFEENQPASVKCEKVERSDKASAHSPPAASGFTSVNASQTTAQLVLPNNDRMLGNTSQATQGLAKTSPPAAQPSYNRAQASQTSSEHYNTSSYSYSSTPAARDNYQSSRNYNHNSGSQSLESHARQSISSPPDQHEVKKARARMEHAGARDLPTVMHYGPLQFGDGGFELPWDTQT